MNNYSDLSFGGLLIFTLAGKVSVRRLSPIATVKLKKNIFMTGIEDKAAETVW